MALIGALALLIFFTIIVGCGNLLGPATTYSLP